MARLLIKTLLPIPFIRQVTMLKTSHSKELGLPVMMALFRYSTKLELTRHYCKRSENFVISVNSEKALFQDVFSDILNTVCDTESLLAQTDVCSEGKLRLEESMVWFQNCLKFTVPNRTMHRGLTVVETYKLLKPNHSVQELHKARTLGWCVELLQAEFIIADDIMDNGIYRRGRLCWYRHDNVGMMAVNDTLFIDCAINRILQVYFKDEPCYVNLIELFEQVKLNTIVGQNMDMMSQQKLGKALSPLDGFTKELYDIMTYCKTGIYSFYLPVALAMHLSEENNLDKLKIAKSVLLKIGHFFQVQNDYRDCYGYFSSTGKVGTDIQEGKCTWLIVKALELANDKQKQILEEMYGSPDEDKVASVKNVFKELNLRDFFLEYKEKMFAELMCYIDDNVTSLPKEIFDNLTKKIFNL